MKAFHKRQAGVAAGMAAGFVATLVALGWQNLPILPHDVDGRIAVWLLCSLSAGLWLLVAVARLAAHRFRTPEDIDGGGLAPNSARAAHLQALVQNTLEQIVLAVPAWGAWLWFAPHDQEGLVVVYAVYFAIGRLLFFGGYRFGAPFRALGFALTFYPTVALYLSLLPVLYRVTFG